MNGIEANSRVTIVLDFTANANDPATITGTLTEPWSAEDDVLTLRKGRRTIHVPAHRVVYVEEHDPDLADDSWSPDERDWADPDDGFPR